MSVDLESNDFDTYLIVRAPDGSQEDNDDESDESSDSSVSLTASQDGTYRVIASSFRPGQGGRYKLTMRREGQAYYVPRGTRRLLGEYGGRLEEGDAQIDSGEYKDEFQLVFEPGQYVQLRVEANFDAYLLIYAPTGGQTDNDDFDGRNPGLDIIEAEAGTYRVLVTSAGEGVVGTYTLSAYVYDPPTAP